MINPITIGIAKEAAFALASCVISYAINRIVKTK